MVKGIFRNNDQRPLKCFSLLAAIFVSTVLVGCISERQSGGWLDKLSIGNGQAAKDEAIRKAAQADSQFPTAAQAGLKSVAR